MPLLPFRIARTIVLMLIVPLLVAWPKAASAMPPKQLKVLAIGNSFSHDGMEHLYQIAADAGIEHIVLGNLTIGGASLETHWNNAQYGAAAYVYDKNTSGSWVTTNQVTLQHGLQDEAWDIITLQQASGFSGIPSSYTAQHRLQNLIDYVTKHKTNPDAKLAWHMTWAYEKGSTHSPFANYGSDQTTMYKAIVNTVQSEIVPNDAFDIIIPSGTALQNVRTSYIGDVLTRDGFHLSLNLGRYIAGLTWLHALGAPIDHITWVPSERDIPAADLPAIKEAVQAAVTQPFDVTPSRHIDRTESLMSLQPSPIPDGYTLLDWEPVPCAYWNSRDAGGLGTVLNTEKNSTAANLCYYVGSARMFTKDDLPMGAIIEVDPGYQYRPEGWDTLTRQRLRPGQVSEQRVIVTDDWWGNYNYRAFTVSYIDLNVDVTDWADHVAARFRIYVPDN